MSPKYSLTATNLSIYQHLSCDLYIYNTYNGQGTTATETSASNPSELSKAQFQRGLDWETCLYSWLDQSNLLLKVPHVPLELATFRENLQFDDRDHFYVTGLSFWPPQRELDAQFKTFKSEPLNFGLAKPDLLEIRRTETGTVQWRVIDAKASKSVKTSHHVQIYFYTLCLQYLLRDPFFECDGTGGVWLPPTDGFHANPPSTEDIKSISISLLAPPLDTFIFRDLPKIIRLPRDKVKWHYNPLCNGCKFGPECRTQSIAQGRIGSMPNISIDEARTLADLLHIARTSSFQAFTPNHSSTDIEDLQQLVSSPERLDSLSRYSALAVKKSKRILGLPKKNNPTQPARTSPVIEAAMKHSIQTIPRYNHTCPSHEDIAVVLSIVHDPASPNPGGEFFCISVFPSKKVPLPRLLSGSAEQFVSTLAELIRDIGKLPQPSVQFYVWSSSEATLLQSHLINAALTSADHGDIRNCIGALAQGVSLLQTTFQPPLLSGALLSFLGKGRKNKGDYVACLSHLGLSTQGTVDQLRKRLEEKIRELQEDGTNADERRKEFGQLPRIVVLKREVERQIALPVPGYWDLPQCTSVLVSDEISCPSDEETFITYKSGENAKLEKLLSHRNQCMLSVLKSLRVFAVLPNGNSVFVNAAKPISAAFMDLCQEPTLRKLFFMQQFEVLSKLGDLWSTRLDGCPDAVTLEYLHVEQGNKGPEYIFRVLTGNIDMSSTEKERSFFDFILTGDPRSTGLPDPYETIPVEALFDDLAVSGLVFPLNRWTRAQWEIQDPRVRDELCVADVRNVFMDDAARETRVALRTWGTWSIRLESGGVYRLSPRLIDFNTTKVLSTLFEMDLRWSTAEDFDYEEYEVHRQIPYLQLILQPESFGEAYRGKELQKREAQIQKRFNELSGLGVEGASSLVLKASQHKAAQRILTNRLSVIWGPPGTGKTYTISLSLLRLLEVQTQDAASRQRPTVVFITAVTHAAIEACCGKLGHLIQVYRSIKDLPTGWLDEVKIEMVTKGNEHAPPKGQSAIVYAGTIYQLWNFTKKHNFEVDCLVVDEAGQISLGAVALVLRSLHDFGRIIIAGDSEQLAPILSAHYPRLKSNMIFGSVLDCLMFSRYMPRPRKRQENAEESQESQETQETQGTQSTIVQLTENFRLNPDLGEFVSTIYSRQFKPQKMQARQIAESLAKLKASHHGAFPPGLSSLITDPIQSFLGALSDVMLRHPQTILFAPEVNSIAEGRFRPGVKSEQLSHRPVSLSLLRLRAYSSRTDDVTYEMHVRGEAIVAAALVVALRKCMPNEDVFVATPHRIQREAVKTALKKLQRADQSLEEALEGLTIGGKKPKVTVDTIERLQGSEAAFVVCLFSLPRSNISDISFLLQRRRLNVAISRAKVLCMLITSDEVLCPSVKSLADEETAKGYAFLKAFEKRAWSYNMSINVDTVAGMIDGGRA